MQEKVFAFDIGTGSLGLAVRQGDEILEARSLILPQEFASTKEERDRRRQYRTRISHQKREQWLRDQCQVAGIEVLEGRRPENRKKGIAARTGDPRLEREFAAPGDDTVYTSCLLRILLLRGEKLEGWQVFKALHSAIQRRGYDPEVPWKKKIVAKKGAENEGDEEKEETKDEAETGKKKKDKASKEERETQKRIDEYEKELRDITGGCEELMFPCYHDAFRMGLWNPSTGALIYRQTHKAVRARYDTSPLADTTSDEHEASHDPAHDNISTENRTGTKGFAPRSLVEKELRALLEAAAKKYPTLGNCIEEIIYGPAKTPYASYYQKLRKQFGLKRGAITDWKGALSQKIPRFDNRVSDKCALISRYNVCRATVPLAIQATFLMKLMNMRYKDKADLDINSEKKRLSPEDVQNIFNEKMEKVKEDNTPEELADIFYMDSKEWKKWLKKKNGIQAEKGDKVDRPSLTGRARFCRLALRLLIELIKSGKSPHAFYEEETAKIINTDPQKDLVKEDLAFLKLMPDDWSKIHIPAVPIIDRYCVDGGDVDKTVLKLIGKQNNPVVRHRLELFWKQLAALDRKYGAPSRVAIELVRGAFAGEEKKQELITQQERNRKKREVAKGKMEEMQWPITAQNLDKMLLFLQQGGICLFTGDSLSCDPDSLEIEHAVPRGEGYEGPDSNLNTVVTTLRTNREKRKRTPYEFIFIGKSAAEWKAYCNRVKDRKANLGKLKVQILTAEHPEELLEKYTSLAETAWIARLAREMVCLRYGWTMNAEGTEQRVIVVKGKLTANARYKKGLNSLLGEKTNQKNRDNPRHHALDAMVLSFITPNKPLIPEHITRNDFLRWIRERTVFEPVAFKKPVLGDTFYGKREYKGEDIRVNRISVAEWKVIKSNIDNILDDSIRQQIQGFRSKLKEYFACHPLSEKEQPTEEERQWREFAATLRQSQRGGAKVLKVVIKAGLPLEYKDLSTDGSGQYKKGKKEHWGQLVYRDKTGALQVRPVYAFESIRCVEKAVRVEASEYIDFFCSGCKVAIDSDVVVGKNVIPAGEYILATITERNRQVELKNVVPKPALSTLLRAGFRRVRPE